MVNTIKFCTTESSYVTPKCKTLKHTIIIFHSLPENRTTKSSVTNVNAVIFRSSVYNMSSMITFRCGM